MTVKVSSLQKGLVAHYTFDDVHTKGTTLKDLTPYRNNGTINGATTGVSGIINEAYDFNGSSDYVRVSDADCFDFGFGDFTYTFWIYNNGKSTEVGRVFCKRTAWKDRENSAYVKTDDSFLFRVFDSDNGNDNVAVTSSSLALNTWHHIVCLKESDQLRLYVNGSQVASGSGIGSVTNSRDLAIGGKFSSQSWDGKLDDFYVFNRALTDTEIKTLCNMRTRHKTKASSLSKGLVGYWPFDDKYTEGTTAKDLSGHGNDGTINGATTGVSGKINEAYDFDGSDDYVRVSDADVLDITDKITLCAWIKQDTVQLHDILSKGDRGGANAAYQLTIENGPARFQITDSSGSNHTLNSSTSLSSGVWYFVVGVYDGSQMKIYIDADLSNSQNYSGDIASIAQPLDIGRNTYWGGPEWFDGTIDEVLVYNRALSESEIKALYNMRIDGETKTWSLKVGKTRTWSLKKGLVGYWPFDDDYTEGTTSKDLSGNENHGTINGATTGESGVINESYLFDGSDDYIAIDGLVYDGTNYTELTLTAWVKTSTSGEQIINSWDRSEYWRFAIEDTIYVGYRNSGDGTTYDIYGNTSVTDGKWHHVVFRFDNGSVTMFLDGKSDATFSHGSTFGSGTTRYGFISMGSEASSFDGNKGPSSYFSGHLDEIMIYTRALSDAEIKTLYNKRVRG